MSREDYDYTTEEAGANGASGENPDDFEIADSACPDRSADDIEGANSFEQIPPGDHLLVIARFTGPPRSEFKTVYLKGRQSSFTSYSVGVKFALAGNPRACTVDYFLLPPVDPSELPMYWEGSSDPDGKKGGGFHANKFYHFIEKLGFPYSKGGKLPADARRLGNWRVYPDGSPRTIYATIEANQYTDRNGNKKEGVRIKLFTFRPSEATIESLAGTSTQAVQQAAQAPESAGQRRLASPRSAPAQKQAASPAAPASAPSGNRYAKAGLNDV